MATIYEIPESPKIKAAGSDSTARYEYHLSGYADEASAILALAAEAPGAVFVGSVTLGSVDYSLDPLDGLGKFRGVADYKHKSRNRDEEELETSGDERITFDFSGETFTRRTCVEGTTQLKFGDNAKDVGNLIGVRNDGTVDGVEVGAPIGNFSVTVLIPDATVTNNWLKQRYKQLYTTNNSLFRSLTEGDCLLVGMSGSKRDDDDWEITYSFNVRVTEHLTEIAGIPLGGSVSVQGFQHVWVMNRKTINNNDLVPEPIGVYIGDVYDKSSFGDLGVST